jgi:hypothetical protein
MQQPDPDWVIHDRGGHFIRHTEHRAQGVIDCPMAHS